MDRKTITLPLLALLCLLPAGCEDASAPNARGEVQGIVLVEGSGLQGVTVELSGAEARSTTTGDDGRYSFSGLPQGAYVVSVRDVPPDASFPAVSKSAVVTGAQTITVDFLGNFIRSASIQGAVTTGARGLSGITVHLEGAASLSTQTGSGGTFKFSGLRAGAYEVEITDFPSWVTFPSVRTSVELGTGQTQEVAFEGTPELTASLQILSITRRTDDGGEVSVDPTEIRGTVDVRVQVDRGEDTLESVELLLGGEVVGRQRFDIGVAQPAREGLASQPARTTPLEIVFSVNTARFDEETGAVRFPNGEHLLEARLNTLEGGLGAWVSTISVTLRNRDTFVGSVRPGWGPVARDDGEDWIGGDLEIEVVPVVYDDARSIASLTVEIRRTAGRQLLLRRVEGGAPFATVFPGSGAPDSENLAGYATPPDSTDQVRLLAAEYDDGSHVQGLPLVLASDLRIDNGGAGEGAASAAAVTGTGIPEAGAIRASAPGTPSRR